MDFSLTQVSRWGRSGDEVFVLMKGEIVPGDYSRLLEFAVNNNVNLAQRTFLLASPGGDVSEALKIGQLLKSLYATVGVGPATGQCASACFIIFASAVRRLATGGMVGIHRPFVHPDRLRSLSPSAAESLETGALLDAEKYLHELRVPTSLVEEMFEQASTEVHWLTERELALQLGQRPPWYKEFLIARCGLDKSAETRFYANRSSIQDNMGLQAAADCERSLTRVEALKNFNCTVQRQPQRVSECK
jgi:hypothetical protein